jgi:hypothetical protein
MKKVGIIGNNFKDEFHSWIMDYRYAQKNVHGCTFLCAPFLNSMFD